MKLEFSTVSPGVAQITFVDPNNGFFFDRNSIAQLTKLIELHGSDFQTIILQSENPRMFSRGFDPSQFRFEVKSLEDVAYGMRLGQRLVTTIIGSPAKIVARVEGLCVGAGLEFALACHKLEFGPYARIQFPEFKAGWVTGYGGIFLFASKYQIPGGIDRLIEGNLVRASLLQAQDPSRKAELSKKIFSGIPNSGDILKLLNAENLESSQAQAIETFLECIKRKFPERFSR